MFCNSFVSNEDVYRVQELAGKIASDIAMRDNIIKEQKVEIDGLHNELSSVYSVFNEFKSELEQCKYVGELVSTVNDFIRKIDDLFITS